MDWFTAYGPDTEPTDAQITAFIGNDLWADMNTYLQRAYSAQPKRSYSGCSGQPGWNVKYQKGGRSLCTLYPMAGFFIALVVVGERERGEAELLMPVMTPYTQALYEKSAALTGARWLMMEIRNGAVLADAKRLIALRRAPGTS